jgi:hypothetical protein
MPNSQSEGKRDVESERRPPRIRDTPFGQKLLEASEQASLLRRGAAVLDWLGLIDSDNVPGNLSGLSERAENLAGLPDRFNEHYAERGWVAYESMNADAMSDAVELAEAGEVEAGEERLVEHYDAETVRFLLNRLKLIEAFEPRMESARNALEDYEAGRYYASIPLVLMLTDGFVNDVRSTGFFAEGTDLTAWDSIAGHQTGLPILAEVMTKPRPCTTDEDLSIPHRHGILHGRDFGYDNEAVAAKAWATLFAVGDWAFAVRNGKPPEEEMEKESPSFWETLKTL